MLARRSGRLGRARKTVLTGGGRLFKMLGPLKKGGVESVEIDGNVTRVFDDGKFKGQITGTNFQKAFLSLWFGSKPVMPELRAALLGN